MHIVHNGLPSGQKKITKKNSMKANSCHVSWDNTLDSNKLKAPVPQLWSLYCRVRHAHRDTEPWSSQFQHNIQKYNKREVTQSVYVLDWYDPGFHPKHKKTPTIDHKHNKYTPNNCEYDHSYSHCLQNFYRLGLSGCFCTVNCKDPGGSNGTSRSMAMSVNQVLCNYYFVCR